MSKLLCIDIETSKILPKGSDLKSYMPLPIGVIGTVCEDGEEKVWHAIGRDGKPARHVTQEVANELLAYLVGKQEEGYELCGWNCISFDLYCLAGLSRDYETCSRLARTIYDPMYQFFVFNGFPISLQAVAQGMSLGMGKVINSYEIPNRWIQGEWKLVYEHVLNDCRMTVAATREIRNQGSITWVKRDKDRETRGMPALARGEEVMCTRMADQSWMTSPIPKWEYTCWIPRKYLPANALGCSRPFKLSHLPGLAWTVMRSLTAAYPNASLGVLVFAITILLVLATVIGIGADGSAANIGMAALITLEIGVCAFVIWFLHRRAKKK